MVPQSIKPHVLGPMQLLWWHAIEPILHTSEKDHGKVELQKCYYFYVSHVPLAFQPIIPYAASLKPGVLWRYTLDTVWR